MTKRIKPNKERERLIALAARTADEADLFLDGEGKGVARAVALYLKQLEQPTPRLITRS
jgi:hypothetical protein